MGDLRIPPANLVFSFGLLPRLRRSWNFIDCSVDVFIIIVLGIISFIYLFLLINLQSLIMVDETSTSDVQLMFPPLFKLPNVEYQVIAEDLGLLSFTPVGLRTL